MPPHKATLFAYAVPLRRWPTRFADAVRLHRWPTPSPYAVPLRRWPTLFAYAVLLACPAPKSPPTPSPAPAIARAALEELFLTREHAAALTLWRDSTVSLTLAALYEPDARGPLMLDSAALGLPVATMVTDHQGMETFFRENRAGWEAWFTAHPANAGLIEVASPRVQGDSATVVVGRACGEHCRNAWRVTLRRQPARWVVQAVDIVPVPKF